MSEKTELTVQDCMAGAFQALLRGDLTERDRLVALAQRAFRGNEVIPADTPVLVAKESLV